METCFLEKKSMVISKRKKSGREEAIFLAEDVNITSVIEATLTAGGVLRRKFIKRKNRIFGDFASEHVVEKYSHELVIEEDLLSQELIVKHLQKYNKEALIYSEELNNIHLLKDDNRPVKFVVDPLDGTHNYCFGFPYWGISIAVVNHENLPVSGVVYLPMMDLLIKCEGIGRPTLMRAGRGWRKIRTSPKPVGQSLICYDNQFYKLDERAYRIFTALVKRCFTTRITGSAVCDIALLATGKINARLWNDASIYDIAAGYPIVQGAGGSVTDFAAAPVSAFSKNIMMCSDSALCREISSTIRMGVDF